MTIQPYGKDTSTDQMRLATGGEGLTNGTRYFVTVRAYDGTWDDSPNIELNTRALGATPPWQREELRLGDDLPAGEIYFMRGLLDPAGTLHLLYNDEADTHLTHVWGATGSWQAEGPGLAAHSAIAFEPTWEGATEQLAIGWSSASDVGVLLRTGADTWSSTTFADTEPGINPQVSLAIGSEWALAYDHDIWGGPVENEVDYYLKRTATLTWQAAEPLEETNLSGRDVDLLLSPADGASPWVALQRGGESTPNRHTPQEGECLYAWWDSGDGAWVYDLVDAGENAPLSDCGKRVQQVLDAGGHPHLAYFDLNADFGDVLGELKYAYHDGSDWQLKRVRRIALDFQTASLQFTYGELGLALADDGLGGQQPVVAFLERLTGSGPGEPHVIVAQVLVRDETGSWRREEISDPEWVFPRDREPCVLLITPDGVWHVFYATTHDQQVPGAADTLVHLWRPL